MRESAQKKDTRTRPQVNALICPIAPFDVDTSSVS